jgi:hypothetical protein
MLGKHCAEALQLARAVNPANHAVIDEIWEEYLEALANPIEPLLTGDRIATIANIAPGPELGRIVADLAEEQAIGAVTTIAEAEAWLRGVRT